MRGMPVLLGLSSLVFAAAGCSNGGGPLAVEARWILSCPLGDPACVPNLTTAHAVSGEEDDPGMAISCDAVSVGDGERAITLRVIDGQRSGELSLRNVIFDEIGTVRTTEGCQATILENGVQYGPFRCGPAVPSAEQPCQIANLDLELDAPEGPAFATSVLCRGVSPASRVPRDLTSPDYDDAVPEGRGAPIRIWNCGGL